MIGSALLGWASARQPRRTASCADRVTGVPVRLCHADVGRDPRPPWSDTARNLLGAGEEYTHLPYFFTDQYDLGMEYVGHTGAAGYDEVVVRGDVEARVISALWLRDDTVVAGMHLNDWDAIDPIRAIVGKPATDRTRDISVGLGDLAR